MIVGLVRGVRLLPWPKFFLLLGGRLILFRKKHVSGKVISGGVGPVAGERCCALGGVSNAFIMKPVSRAQ